MNRYPIEPGGARRRGSIMRTLLGVEGGATPAPGPAQDRVTGMELSLRDQTRARIDAYRAEEAAKARAKEAARAEWVEFFRSQIENVEIT